MYVYICIYMHFIYIYRGDFDVHFKHANVLEKQQDNVSVFQLCYNMTLNMLKISTKSNEKAIYNRILWSK